MLIISILKTIVLVAVYLLSCASLGAVVTTRIVGRPRLIGAGVFYASSMLLGQGLLAGVWLLLALAGYFNLNMVVPTSLAAIFLGWKSLMAYAPELSAEVKAVVRNWKNDPFLWQVLVLASLILAGVAGLVLGRPITGDATSQNLVVGKVIAATGYLTKETLPGLYNIRLQMGLLSEMHFAVMFLFNNQQAAQILEWPTTLAGGLMLIGICQLCGLSLRARWFAWLCLFTSPAVPGLIQYGKVDLYAIAMATAASYWSLLIGFQKQTKSVMLVAGLFIGFAIVAKFSFIPALLLGCGLLMIWALRDQFYSEAAGEFRVKALLGAMTRTWPAVLAFLIATAPHFIKSVWLDGDPFITFTSKDMSVMYTMTVMSKAVANRVLTLYPLSISLMPTNHNLSILVVMFLPLALFLPRPRRFFSSPLVAITIVACAGQMAWIILKPTVLVWRYLFPSFMLLIPLAAHAADNILCSNTVHQKLRAAAWVAVFVTFNWSYGFYYRYAPGLYDTILTFTAKSPEDCLSTGDSHCKGHGIINADSQLGDRVMVLSDMTYWLRPDLIQCAATALETGSSLTNTRYIYADMSMDDRWRSLYEQGFRYIFVDQSEPAPTILKSFDIENVPTWVHPVRLSAENEMVVYRLDFDSVPGLVRQKKCALQKNSYWKVVRAEN